MRCLNQVFNEEVEGDGGKASGQDHGEESSGAFDDRIVLGVVDPQGLEGTLKAVVQVETNEEHGQNINACVPPHAKVVDGFDIEFGFVGVFLKGFHESGLVHVGGVVGVSDGNIDAKPAHEEEGHEVQKEEHQHHNSRPHHVPGHPGRAGVGSFVVADPAPGGPVLFGQQQPIHNVEEQEGEPPRFVRLRADISQQLSDQHIKTLLLDEDGNIYNEQEIITSDAFFNDGMTVDANGNIYIGNSNGVEVWSPDGEYWGVITLPDDTSATNVAFGTDSLNTLYITNRSTNLYAVQLNAEGIR